MENRDTSVARETSVIKCKKCLETKTRYLAGKYSKGDKKWVDEQGKMWNGHVCPPCNQIRAAGTMKASRSKV
jgi:hypothetical protein